MPILDIRKLVRSALDGAKRSEHADDSDPSVIHLKDAVVRSMAELEVARGERSAPGEETSPAQDELAKTDKGKKKLPHAA